MNVANQQENTVNQQAVDQQARIDNIKQMLAINEQELLNAKLQLEVAKLREEVASYNFQNTITMYGHMNTMYRENEAGRLIYEGSDNEETRKAFSKQLIDNCTQLLKAFSNEKSNVGSSDTNPES